jgi:hypothetical protein
MNISLEITELTLKLRNKLTAYRFFHKDSIVPLDINAIDIAVSLVEYSLNGKRVIAIHEQNWFDATYLLNYVLSGSEWEDMVDLYSELATLVKKHNYFRE